MAAMHGPGPEESVELSNPRVGSGQCHITGDFSSLILITICKGIYLCINDDELYYFNLLWNMKFIMILLHRTSVFYCLHLHDNIHIAQSTKRTWIFSRTSTRSLYTQTQSPFMMIKDIFHLLLFRCEASLSVDMSVCLSVGLSVCVQL